MESTAEPRADAADERIELRLPARAHGRAAVRHVVAQAVNRLIHCRGDRLTDADIVSALLAEAAARTLDFPDGRAAGAALWEGACPLLHDEDQPAPPPSARP